MAMCVFAYLHIWVIWVPTKSPKKYRRLFVGIPLNAQRLKRT
jgi:hypothetical protein